MPRLHHSQFNHLVKVPGEGGWALYNFATGTLERLDEAQKALFDAAPSLPADSTVVRRWRAAGFLCAADEVALARRVVREHVMGIACGRAPLPLMLTVCVTERCNFACPYCFQEPGSLHMPREVQDALVRFAESRLATGTYDEVRVDWFGGEPLLVPDAVEHLSGELIALAERFGVPYKALAHTNGYLLDQKMADMLESCRVAKVIVTVDGDCAAHDATRRLRGGGPTYDRIVGNLSALRTGMSVHVRCNLSADNVKCLDGLRDLVSDIASSTGTAMRVVPAAVRKHPVAEARGGDARPPAPAVFARILRECGEVERKHAFEPSATGCPIVRLNELYITARGEIYPSCHAVAGQSEYALGNVLDDDPVDWETAAQMLLDEFAFPDDQPDCLACKLLPCCYGGCPEVRWLTGRHECPELLADADAYVLSKL